MILFISLFIICVIFYPAKTKYITVGSINTIRQSDNRRIMNNRDAYLIFVMFALCLICGLRDRTIGVDTVTYIETFESQSVLNTVFLHGEVKFEIGYKFLVQAIRLITNNANCFIFICAALSFIGLYFFIRDNCKENYQIAMMIFMAFLYYTTFSAIRQSIALAIGVNSITYLKRKNWIKASILIIIGGLFHYTELVVLIMVPLSMTKWTKKKISFSIIIAAAMIGLFPRIMAVVTKYIPVYNRYLSTDFMDSSGSIIGLFSLLTIALVGLGVYKLVCNYTYLDEDTKNILIMAIVGSVFAVAFDLLGHQYAMLSRVTRFYIPYIMVLGSSIYGNIKSKFGFNIIVIVLMFIFYVTKINANVYAIIPYKSFLGW